MLNHGKPNKYRGALEVLQKGKDALLETLADDIIHQADNLMDGGFLFNEFLEVQGARMHLLALLVCQLEEAATALEERQTAQEGVFESEPPSESKTPAPRRSRPKTKKLP